MTIFKVIVIEGYATLSSSVNKFRVALFERVHV